jgi:hypothetical protein
MLCRFLRRTEAVEGDGFDSQPLARVVSVKGTVLDRYPSDIHRARGQARRPVSPE